MPAPSIFLVFIAGMATVITPWPPVSVLDSFMSSTAIFEVHG